MKNIYQIEETQNQYEIINDSRTYLEEMISLGGYDFPEEALLQEISFKKKNAINNCNQYLVLAFCEANKSDNIRDDNYIIRLLKMAKKQADKYYEGNTEPFVAEA